MTDIDLSPRDIDPQPRSKGKRARSFLLAGVLIGALAFVLYQALTSATQYYLNVDEAVAQREELGDQTFRIQGTVVSEHEVDANGAWIFKIAYNGAHADIHHVGEEPTDLFEVGIPVVAEGRWDGQVFQSRQLLVKHSEAYEADNPDRVDYDLDPADGDSK